MNSILEDKQILKEMHIMKWERGEKKQAKE